MRVLFLSRLLGRPFFFSSRRRHTRYWRDWSSDVCSSDLALRRDRSEHARSQVAPALERIDERAVGEPPRHRVDGEVAAPEVVLNRCVTVGHDLEVVPAGPGRALAARRRELDPGRRQAPHLAVARVQTEAYEPARDDEVLDAPVRLEPRAQLLRVDARNKEVRILRFEPEQLVADGAADEVGVEVERAHVVLDRPLHADNVERRRQGRAAIASISTSAPDGSFATSNVDRAGGRSPTCRAYTSFIPAKSPRSWRKTVVLTRLSSDVPASSRIARRLAKICSVCSAIAPSATWFSPGRSASWPETNTNPFALIACEYGAPWNGAGAASVRTTSFMLLPAAGGRPARGRRRAP